MSSLRLIAILLLLNSIILCDSHLNEDHKVIIAHRGASGYAPEHSLVAYTFAMELQSDYIEPDLLLTKDNHFIAMHDIVIDNVTNIMDHPEFLDRYTTKQVPNKRGILEYVSGHFVDDFTLNELKSLRLRQRGRWKGRHHSLDDIFTIPTLNEIAQLVKTKHEQKSFTNYNNYNNHAYNKNETPIGIYIELKHPDYYALKGISVGQMLLNELNKLGFQTHTSSNSSSSESGFIPPRIVIQTFDAPTLEYLSHNSNIPLVRLIEPHDEGADLSTIQWGEMKNNYNSKLSGVGIDKNSLTALSLKTAQSHIAAIHKAGMVVHSYTSRADHYDGIAIQFNQSFFAETMYLFCCLNVDGIFIEQPDLGREYGSTLRAQWQDQGYDSENEFSNTNLNGCPISCEDFQPDITTTTTSSSTGSSSVNVMIDITSNLSEL